MRTPAPYNISVADLAAAGLRLRPAEAVTIARELTLRVHRGELPGIPSANVLRFTSDGDTICEGPVAAGESVERAGRLLESLLPGFDAPPEFRVPGALRLVVARALGTLDLPAYPTLDEFAQALLRFASGDMATVVAGLVRTWQAAVDSAEAGAAPEATDVGSESADLTISDVRRARRATGLRLADVAERSRIPISLLRELEWGYFVNWPSGHYGRIQLVRYARAAGLDVDVVTTAVAPLLEEAVKARDAQARVVEGSIVEEGPIVKEGSILGVENDEQPADRRLVKFERGVLAGRPHERRRPIWLAALAIPALLAIGFVPAAWQSIRDGSTPATPAQAAQAIEQKSASEQSKPQATRAPAAAAPKSGNEAADVEPAAVAKTAPAAGPDRADLPSDAAFSPAFASVGSAMFYHADAGDSSAIMRADTDTSGAVLRVTSIVDDESKNFHARPSPDGSMIAFDSDREGERAVYIADANGRNVRRVSGEGFAAVPSWSPDGRTLAFVRAEAGRPNVWNLWMANIHSGQSRRLTSYRVGQPWGAAWFPDGDRIAYSHEDRLIIRSLETGQERVYPSPKKGRLIRTPAVSPDGRRVMFQVYKDGAWLLDVGNGGMRKVLMDPTAEEFTWSPDGRRVAYHSRKAGGWGVWMMAAR